MTSEPRMSEGMRSGVNCTRRACKPEDDAQRLHELRLGQARNADQKAVTAREQRHQRLFDDLFLPENHLADLAPRRRDSRQRRLGASRANAASKSVGPAMIVASIRLPLSAALARPVLFSEGQSLYIEGDGRSNRPKA